MKPKGLEMITVNSGDSKQTITGYWSKEKFTMPVGMGGSQGSSTYAIFAKFGVQAFPTNYVIDANGRVAWRSVGFDEAGLRAALKKLGVQ